MTSFASALDRDAQERDQIAARCKSAPSTLDGPREVFEAWQQFQRFRGKSDVAYTRYMQAGIGTETQRRHLVRYQAYEDVAEGWEKVLDDHLRTAAGKTS